MVFGMSAGLSLMQAQNILSGRRALASNVIVPQQSAISLAGRGGVEMTGVRVRTEIAGQTAVTEMKIYLLNRSRSAQEAELMLPVPENAVFRGFDFGGKGKEPSAELLPREKARKIYEGIVRRMRDPALLEFADTGLVRTSVFPVPGNGTQVLKLVYEQVLASVNGRVDYVIPRSESLAYSIPWRFEVLVRSKDPISTVYSPSHELEVRRISPTSIRAVSKKESARAPGSFRISCLRQQSDITASLMAYPEPGGGGYFLLLAGLPAATDAANKMRKREVTLVIDRSGSMRGKKIKQVREAAEKIVSELDDGEAFNIITYNESVDCFSSAPVIRNRQTHRGAIDFIRAIRPSGGTNIHDAIFEALRQKPVPGMLPLVIFLSDGLPTIGRISEEQIRDVAMRENRYQRRIFTVGVGPNVNAPLLDRIALQARGVSEYVLSDDQLTYRLESLFRKLSGPVLASPEISAQDSRGNPCPDRFTDMLPQQLPDLYKGDQLVLLGRYRKEKSVTFMLSGDYLGKKRHFRFQFKLDSASTRNSFVPRLWASRKIAYLVDQVRQSGNGNKRNATVSDELTREIVNLSVEFGILTEYTAFFARQGSCPDEYKEILRQTSMNLRSRALNHRHGLHAVNQSMNFLFQSSQKVLNYRNSYVDSRMNHVQTAAVQQINDLAFYNRDGKWIDSRAMKPGRMKTQATVVKFGSPEFSDLFARLMRQNRQGAASLNGDVIVEVGGRLYHIVHERKEVAGKAADGL